MSPFKRVLVVVAVVGAGLWLPALTVGQSSKRGAEKSATRRNDTRSVSAVSTNNRPRSAVVTPASLVSSEIDSLLATELSESNVELSPVIGDEDFLRRAYIDLTGKPPTADRIDAFVSDTDPNKRSKLVDELLKSDDYARNWARYWRDVLLYHSLDPRARLGAEKAEEWLAEQIRDNVHWDKIATELITAKGPVVEDGRTFLVFAQFDGTPENVPVNVVSEATRVFLGIQLQCAQCHDHPYDEWKREQFHEMAAFFARTAVFRQPGDVRSFEVKSKDELARGRPGFAKAAAKRGGAFGLEHRMPDNDDPENSTIMHPKFLLGQKPAEGLSDSDRRALFASYVTDKNNPWFARAYVNRIWSELMGEGFYEPVDDLGPGREARFPIIVNRLAAAWRASNYDMKWLFRVIVNTQAYQREIRPRDASTGALPFASVCPTRLSADQIFDSLISALGIHEDALRGAAAPQGRRYGAFGARGVFNAQFGVDPSTPTEDIQGTIPQALFMMNSPLIANQINAEGDTILGRLLAVYDDDLEIVRLLYKRVLSRAPTDEELATCTAYIAEIGNRHEAFEDLLWGLLNSTEFITKR